MADFIASEKIDFLRGCVIDFDINTGISTTVDTIKRYLGQMHGIFSDDESLENEIKKGDRIVYEFHGLDVPNHPGDLAYGMSIVYPGKVGNEYYMTKGHFHSILETGEVYYCLKGHGYMLLEDPEGDWSAHELTAGKAVYVPKRYAHRSINVSDREKLITFSCIAPTRVMITGPSRKRDLEDSR